MSEKWPRVGVMLFTYNRMEHAVCTIVGLADNLRYSGPIALNIGDDGTPDPKYAHILAEAAWLTGAFERVTMTNSRQRGYGASYNASTNLMHDDCPILLPLEDDWVLTDWLDLDPLVRTLMRDPRYLGDLGWIGCIRLGYIGFTQELRGHLVETPAGLMLRFAPDSPEPHVAAGHPRLETRSWERRVGPWREGLAAGATEVEWCGRAPAREGVAWPLDVLRPSEHRFAHIGSESLGEREPTGAAAEA